MAVSPFLSPSSTRTFRNLSSLTMRLLSRRRDASIMQRKDSSLMVLSDDILIIILDILYNDVQSEVWPKDRDLPRFHGGFVRLSTVNRRMRALASVKLYKVLHLGPSWGTERMQTAIKHIRHSDGALQYAREVKIDLWMAPSATGTQETQFATAFVCIIPYFVRLTRLSVTVPEGSAVALKLAFEESSALYPNITELVLSPPMSWLISLCPNVRSVSTNDWINMYATVRHEIAFLEEAARVSELEHISLHCCWHEDTIAIAARCLPQLKSIALPGGCLLPELLPKLQSFPALERLRLAQAHRLLQVMPSTPALQIARQQAESSRLPQSGMYWPEEVIIRMVFGELPKLKQLMIGHRFIVIAVDSFNRPLPSAKRMYTDCDDLKGPQVEVWLSRETRQITTNPCR